MKTNDIEIGKRYLLSIWDDDEPFHLKCVGKEDGYFYMESPALEYEMLIGDNDQFDGLIEVISCV